MRSVALVPVLGVHVSIALVPVLGMHMSVALVPVVVSFSITNVNMYACEQCV
jgi:uncharacterized membrane protein